MKCEIEIDFKDISINTEMTYYNHVYYNLCSYGEYKSTLLFDYDNTGGYAVVSLGDIIDGKFVGSVVGECYADMDVRKVGNTKTTEHFTIYGYDVADAVLNLNKLVAKLIKDQQALTDALVKYEDAFDSFLAQYFSYEMTNARGQSVDCTVLNEAHCLAGKALKGKYEQ